MSDVDLPDVNVLIALLHPDHMHHRSAQSWFAQTRSFATTPITESGLLRLAINPAIGASAPAAAVASLRSLREHPRAVFLPDDTSLTDQRIGLDGLVGFRQVTDLHLVNLAARHGARLVTFDQRLRPALMPADQERVHLLA